MLFVNLDFLFQSAHNKSTLFDRHMQWLFRLRASFKQKRTLAVSLKYRCILNKLYYYLAPCGSVKTLYILNKWKFGCNRPI